MALEKKLPTITQSQINAKGVSALADRPNVTGQYGQSGMSPAQLKAWFDNLANLLAKNISEISDIFSGDDAAKYIRICLDNYNIDNLDKLVESFNDGTFAKQVIRLVNPFSASSELATLETVFGNVLSKFVETVAAAGEDALNKANDAQTNANNYTDEIVSQAVTDINTNTIKPLREQVDQQDRDIASAKDDIVRVEGLAKGSQLGVGYETYLEMVNTINGAEKTALNKFQSVYIGTDEVPDLWVFKISDEFKQYTYTSEEDFASDLITNKKVQVGYFIFKRLEWGKVPLENYYTKNEVDAMIEKAVEDAGFFLEEYI